MGPSRTSRPRFEDQPAGDARGGETPALRVVVLASDAGALAQCPTPLQCIRVASPYEAAAEILAAPTAALVVDLRLVAGRHLRLLEIARQMEVELLAVGAVPPGLTSEDLSGVRLTARADLPAVLARLAQERPAATAELPLAEPIVPEPAEEPDMSIVDEPPQAQEPEAEVVEPVPAEDLRAEAMRNRQAAAAAPPAEAGRSPSQLLTPEELKALLEREP